MTAKNMLCSSMSEKQQFLGDTFYRRPSGYYNNRKGQNMHRIVWAAHHGPIRPGFDIHHIDGDKSNNALENLQCLTRAEHNRLHYADADRSALQAEVVKTAQAVSQIKDIAKTCAQCAAPITVTRLGRTRHRFCGPECKSRWDYANKKGFRTATCEACAATFETKCRKTRTCSYACGWQLRKLALR